MNDLVRTINFHGIGTPGADIPPDERPYWIEPAFFEQIIDLIADAVIRNEIAITFDDGNLSDLEIAAPILQRRKLPARFFVLTGRLEKSGYLTRDDANTLRDMGFKIGSHGENHVNWAKLSDKDLERETWGSKERLEFVLGAHVREAAIPFGSYNRRVLTALKRAGYTVAWTSDGGPMNPNRFLRPRMSVRNDMSIEDVRRALFDPISKARTLRRSLAMARKRLF
ncbi:polysaccharide deacetylase family protein [Arenibacterium sp. CAU 1754]